MGTMMRLMDAIANNDSLEIYPLPYTGIPGAKFVSETRLSANLARDISGNRVPVTLQGAPMFTDKSVRGGGGAAAVRRWLKAAYAPEANESRTMCVVAKRASVGGSAAFAFSDYSDGTGCSLFIDAMNGWRAQVIVTNGSAISSVFPTISPNLPVMDINAWQFAVLVVDAENRKAAFKLPALGYSAEFNWAADKTVAVGAGELRIAGTSTAQTDSCDVAFASYHNRALSDVELLQQYYAARAYCNAVGVDI